MRGDADREEDRAVDTRRSEQPSKDTGVAPPTTVFGIKAKLILAFCTLAGLTALASGVAWYVFIEIDRSVSHITIQTIPGMATSLRLAEKSAEIATAAPTLVASTNQQERVLEGARLEERVKELDSLMASLSRLDVAEETITNLAEIERRITAELGVLNDAVEKRLRFKAQREAGLAALSDAHVRFLETSEPLVDDAVFELVISGEEVTAQGNAAITDLVEGGVGTIHQLLAINAEGNLAAGLLVEAAHVADPTLIQPIRERFLATAAAIERSLRQLPDTPEKAGLKKTSESLLILGIGADNLFEVRERELRASAAARVLLRADRERMTSAVKAAHQNLLDILTPMVDDAGFDVVVTSEEVTAESTKAITNLIDVGVNTLHVLLTVRAEGNLAAGVLNEAAGVLDKISLQPLRERFIAAANRMERTLAQLSESADDGTFRRAAEALIAFGRADDGIFEVRRQELLQIAAAQRSLEASRSLATRLGDEVGVLVTAAQRASDAAALRSAGAIANAKLLTMLFSAAGIVGAVMIVLFYVTPRIVRPLENITAAMSDLAAGDTSVDIPGRDRSDEMGRMAQALGVFRDTAIEVQESNLREIRDTRRRLSDAIESITEGFSLYDGDDRLVVCNSRYRELLYPGMEEQFTPGMSFETIARRAAESGYVKDAENRVEEWLRERMARHRQPGGPHIQRRGDGRWILVSERKTDDGGTVAVYSDITELKEREEELDQKSNSLEQLSNQLAKYLSPQVYDSIFTGRQEVKLASQRKKLTIFFSDIAGFTETADRLESEDLTQLLNHYLTEMSRIALAFGATIDKYVGDAIVIFFGDPETRGVKGDALACVEMAIAMRKRMRELKEVWRASGIENPLRCRIGINTGYCTVGNFGSEDRMDYTIIGGGVNLASRLESAATPGEILISYETFAQVRDRIHCEEHGQITVKGIAYPVTTYQVVDSHENLDNVRHLVHVDEPNLKIDLDPQTMSADERSRATAALSQALERLSGFDRSGRSGKPAKNELDRPKKVGSRKS